MSNIKKEIMKQKIKDIESDLNKRLFKVTDNINTFFYDMLNDFSVSVWFPLLSDIIQYLHILFYPFKDNVRKNFYFYFFIYSYHLFISKINFYFN